MSTTWKAILKSDLIVCLVCPHYGVHYTPIEASYITRQLINVDKKDIWNTQHVNESFTQMTLTDFGVC